MTPRLSPLPADQRDERTEELLASMPRAPDGSVLNLFATLAHHPKLLARWSAFGGVLLFRGALSGRDRELVILRTALLCRAEYEWGQHVRMARDAGITDEEIDRVVAGADATGWDTGERALLTAADELHAASCISDATWSELASRYDERQLIELCMLVGQYHLVAFTLNSLGIEPEPGLPTMPAHP